MHNNNNFNKNVQLDQINNKLVIIINNLLKRSDNIKTREFLDNQEFIQYMNISKRTAQKWRNQGIVIFSKIGNKYYYKISDIIDLINNNKQSNPNNI